MSCLTNVRELYGMMEHGQMLDAFDKFYHDDVVMQENNEPPRKGKKLNREFEVNWLESVKEIHAAGIKGVTSDEENHITMVESWMDISFDNGLRQKMEEVAVQRWMGNKVINEKFYYSNEES